MSSAKITNTFSPGVLSVLPMIYVGWSDSVLSPTEIAIIQKQIKVLTFLTEDDKAYLTKCMNPSSPPVSSDFKRWLRAIKDGARYLTKAEKSSLLELGIQLALSHVGQKEYHQWNSPKTRQALSSIERALGVHDVIGAQTLLTRMGDSQEVALTRTRDRFEVRQMKKVLDGEHSLLMDRIRKLLRDPSFDLTYENDKDIYRIRILKQLKLLADQGLSAYSFPKKYGGGERKGDHIAVFETIAYGDLSLTIKFGVQFGLFGGAIFQLGTEYHHRKYLEKMHRRELLGCFAMTETGHGSNVKEIETIARYDIQTDTITIDSPSFSAGKEYIGNALHSTHAVVFAQLIVREENCGVHAILARIRRDNGELIEGVKVEDNGYKMGLNGVDNGRIWFDTISVPRQNLLNKYGSINESGEYSSPIENSSKRFFTMLGTLVVGRISVGLASISASKKALAIAVKYALKRRQFASKKGEPESLLIDYPSHQARLIPYLAKVYGYHFALRKLAHDYSYETESDPRKIETLAAGLKAKASWLCTAVIQECREACGGKGYLHENQIPSLKADTDIFTTFEGDNTVLMQLVAKGLLTEFKQSFHDEGFRAVMRYILKKAGHRMKELNPVQKRNTDYIHLTSESFFKHAFEFRYEKMLLSISDRMRKFLKRGMDPYQAFLRTQVHLIDLAHAHIDQIVLESFHKVIDSTDDPRIHQAMTEMFKLFCISNIYDNLSWYLENNYMEGTKAKAIRRVRAKLMQHIRGDILAYVDSFGIPDELLEAPIALKDYS